MNQKEKNKIEEYFIGNNQNSEFIEKLFIDVNNESELKKIVARKWNEILSSRYDNIDLNHILYKIHYDINTNNNASKIPVIKRVYNFLSKAAVILIIPMLIFSIFLLHNHLSEEEQYTQIVSPKGEKSQFVLPDGTKGYLNSGSVLKYSFPFSKNRIVKLTGEAFFDVTRGKNKFVVQTKNLNIIVHGTRFNVSAYNDDPNIITTLEKGCVSIVSNKESNEVKLAPGQQLVYRKDNDKMLLKKVDVDLYVSWKENMLKFYNAPFADVVKKMERWYDVNIILEENLKYTQRYTMTIKTESLREMLELMVITTPMKYKIEEDNVYINYKKK